MKIQFESVNEFGRGAIAGSLSAIVICLFLELLELMGLAKHCWLFMAGQAVMQFQHVLLPVALAFLIHIGVGVFWGVIIAFLFTKVFTDRYHILKGLAIGAAIFFFHLGLLSQVLNYPPALRNDIVTIFFIFLSYLLYGALTAIIIKKIPAKESG